MFLFIAASLLSVIDMQSQPADSLLQQKKALCMKTVCSGDTAVCKGEKHFWRAAGETFGLNVGLWAFDRYVLKGHYSYISLKTIRENFKHGFDWDNDHLSTNMFAHPYHGSLYFNAGRANGFNFWQSELFALGGSAMWELFMESEYENRTAKRKDHRLWTLHALRTTGTGWWTTAGRSLWVRMRSSPWY